MKKYLLTKVRLIPASILLFSIFFGSSLLQELHAQAVSPALMQLAQGELQKRGLTEAEVTARLFQKGIDVNTIAPAEFPAYQARVTAVLNELEAEKKAAAAQTTTPAQTTPININIGGNTPAAALPVANQPGTQPTATNVVQGANTAAQVPTTAGTTVVTTTTPQTTPQEAAAEAAIRVAEVAGAREATNIYGHALFTDHSLDVFRTTDGAQAPDTYVLGAGDEVHITIFGASQTDIQQRISNEGYIQPTGVARIFLKGLTLAQARSVIRQSLSSSYLFRADQLAVTIVTARTVLINVFGETNITGGFTLSALNSALNALSAAGGPSNLGSVREIQLIRGTTKKNIDLYAFMNDPSVQYSYDLQQNDILYVPVAKKLVRISGGIKRPMRYEMLDGESLKDLIAYAGGLTTDVNPDFVQIQRYDKGEVKLFEWNLADVTSGKTSIALQNGDEVRIQAINRPMEAYVEVEGSVYYPGRYDLTTNPTLSRLLAKSQLNFQAKTDIIFIERTRPDLTVELLTVPNTAANANMPLQGRDKVRIMDQTTYRDVANIAVNGQVRRPFEKEFALNDRMTVAQAIDYAGGLRENVYPVAYIFRRNLFNPSEMKYIQIELEKDGATQLQPGDRLNVYDNTTYTNVGELRIAGAVKNPTTFTYDASMQLRDLIINAGGFTIGAAFNKVDVFRTVLSTTATPKLEQITLEFDSTYHLISPTTFTLQPYDQVIVRLVPEFSLARVVELNGQVMYPGPYVLETKETTLADVINRAGGLLTDADPYGARLFRTYRNRGNISIHLKKAMRHKGDLSYNPILFEGDVININRQENTVTILETGTRMAQYSLNPEANKTMVYQGKRSAGWYIRNFAGGFQKNANRMSVTVTYANNQMQSTKRILFFRNYPTVQPGSTITLQMDPDKILQDATPREKVDWEGTVAKGLSTLMSTLSIILILQKL